MERYKAIRKLDNGTIVAVQMGREEKEWIMLETDYPKIWKNLPQHHTVPKVHDQFIYVDHLNEERCMVVHDYRSGEKLEDYIYDQDQFTLRKVMGDIACGMDHCADKSIIPDIENIEISVKERVTFTHFLTRDKVKDREIPEWFPNEDKIVGEFIRKRTAWCIGRWILSWLTKCYHSRKNNYMSSDLELLILGQTTMSKEDRDLLVIADRCLVANPKKRISLNSLKMMLTGASCE